MASYGAVNEGKSNALICSMCSNELDEFDLQENYHFKWWIGYGSKYDLNIFECRLCCHCFDQIIDTIIPMFKNSPLSEYEIVSDDGNKLIAKRKEK